MNGDLRGRRILVVEDNALLALSLDEILREVGAVVAGPAATLDAAELLAAENDLSAALLDIRLNGDEVWPVARILASKGVPFVFCTGHFDRTCLPVEWSERPILTKPARAHQIIAALADLVGDRA